MRVVEIGQRLEPLDLCECPGTAVLTPGKAKFMLVPMSERRAWGPSLLSKEIDRCVQLRKLVEFCHTLEIGLAMVNQFLKISHLPVTLSRKLVLYLGGVHVYLNIMLLTPILNPILNPITAVYGLLWIQKRGVITPLDASLATPLLSRRAEEYFHFFTATPALNPLTVEFVFLFCFFSCYFLLLILLYILSFLVLFFCVSFIKDTKVKGAVLNEGR